MDDESVINLFDKIVTLVPEMELHRNYIISDRYKWGGTAFRRLLTALELTIPKEHANYHAARKLVFPYMYKEKK